MKTAQHYHLISEFVKMEDVSVDDGDCTTADRLYLLEEKVSVAECSNFCEACRVDGYSGLIAQVWDFQMCRHCEELGTAPSEAHEMNELRTAF